MGSGTGVPTQITFSCGFLGAPEGLKLILERDGVLEVISWNLGGDPMKFPGMCHTGEDGT